MNNVIDATGTFAAQRIANKIIQRYGSLSAYVKASHHNEIGNDREFLTKLKREARLGQSSGDSK